MKMFLTITLHEVHSKNMILAKLKELRQAKKMTQDELAKRIGIDRSMVAKIEAGKNINPTLNILEKMAAELGASVEILSDNQTVAE